MRPILVFVTVELLTACRSTAPPQLAARPDTRKLRDLVRVEGTGPMFIWGYGLVVGLPGTGDSAGGETERLVKRLSGVDREHALHDLDHRQVALVLVSVKLGPGSEIGVRLDVGLSTLGDAESIAGGRLLPTKLHDGYGRVEYATAEGKLPDGVGMSALLRLGATVTHDFPGLQVALLLRRQDRLLAEAIATRIGARRFEANWVEIEVRRKGECDFASYIENVLDTEIPIPDWALPTVVLDDGEGRLVWWGRVTVNPGIVNTFDGRRIVIRSEDTPVEDVLLLAGPNYATRRNVIRALFDAGMLKATLIALSGS